MQDESLPLPAVAVLSSADLGGFGDQLLAAVIERELLARLPDVQIVSFAPLGWDRPGSTATPLARPERATTARITESAQSSVLCPAFPLGDDLSARYSSPQAQWAEPYFAGGLVEASHAVVACGVRVVAKPSKALVTAVARRALFTVRDKVSRERLKAAGEDIAIVPHPGLAVKLDGLAARAESLRKLGVLPEGSYVVSAVPIDGEQVVPLPEDGALEDKLAIIANARFVVASDEHMAAAAAGLDVPWVLLDPTGEETPPVLEFGVEQQIVRSADDLPSVITKEFPSRKAELLTVLDEHFGKVAKVTEMAVLANDGSPLRRWARLAEENRALRHANARLRERMVVERNRMIDPIADVVTENDKLTKELEAARAQHANMVAQNQILMAQVAERDRELLAWQNIRLIRWTNPIRNAYSKVRSFVR
ncbi:regulator of replication initiation timing [Kibdelosporangium banguiense]|uniref:Regulator of replication initiation timing n=1 Tax=Kibdelosporangium banguiense TaxID=1365924 RepID=A0ABS4TBF3_9PSEU|nr:polysaccharide pyruvyl transferase family protein [Kibdelosporangium banguiense]MBP2321750.1 regulator of replication initiation timing [Kibdelosporangium banguiense]